MSSRNHDDAPTVGAQGIGETVASLDREGCESAQAQEAPAELLREAAASRGSDAGDNEGARPIPRRGFLKKAAMVAGVIFVGIPVANRLFFRSDANEPSVRQEGSATVISNSPTAYHDLEVVECEWVWPESHGTPMVLFGIKSRSDSVVIRKVDVRVMVLGKRGHLLAEECVTIPSILPGEVCRMGTMLAGNPDHWIGRGNSIDSTYQDEFDRVVVLVSGAGEKVTGESFRRDWPYEVAYFARDGRNYAKVEVTLQESNVGRAELGEAVLSAAYVCLVWRNADGSLLDVYDLYIEGLEEGVTHTVDLATISKEMVDEIYVRPWRRDENIASILRGVEVVQQRY